jgi:uracil-DNA glycosylase
MINRYLQCSLPCSDVNKDFIVPNINIIPEKIRLVMVSEAPPKKHEDYFYKDPTGSFFKTTHMAFADAGIEVSNYLDLTRMGVYLTTAIKCSKKGYLVSSNTIKECSVLLEKEIDQFPNLRVVMCMGDFAIKAINYISRRNGKGSIIPSASTYKIRKGSFEQEGIRYFPSYTQTGEGFDIEKSKRRMISEDISKAMAFIEK